MFLNLLAKKIAKKMALWTLLFYANGKSKHWFSLKGANNPLFSTW
jgi:hypothetical protein